MPNQEIAASIDMLISNWNTGFSVLSKRRSSGMPVSASDVHKNVIDAGTNIFRCGLNPSVVAESGHKVKEFNDIYGRVKKTQLILGDETKDSEHIKLEVNPIQLAAIKDSTSPDEAQALISSIQAQSDFDPLTAKNAVGAGAGGEPPAQNALILSPSVADIRDKAKEISIDLLKNHPLPATAISAALPPEQSSRLDDIVVAAADTQNQHKPVATEDGSLGEQQLSSMPSPIVIVPKPDELWSIPHGDSTTSIHEVSISLHPRGSRIAASGSAPTETSTGIFGADSTNNSMVIALPKDLPK